MISDLDKNKSGSIDFEEFLDMMTARMSDKDTERTYQKFSDFLMMTPLVVLLLET